MKPVKPAVRPNSSPAILETVTSRPAHEKVPQKVSENDRIRKAVEVAGLRMTGDPIQLGGNLFVGLHPPATASIDSKRLRRSLEAAGFRVSGEPIPLGGKLFVGVRPRSLLNKDVPVLSPSLSPQVALPAAVDVTTRAKKAQEQRRDQLAAHIAKKLNDPAGNPTMTVEQVAHAFSASKATIYRWIDKGRRLGPDKIQLTWAAHGKIPTDLVQRTLAHKPKILSHS